MYVMTRMDISHAHLNSFENEKFKGRKVHLFTKEFYFFNSLGPRILSKMYQNVSLCKFHCFLALDVFET